MLEYISKHEGFVGVIKMRYQDFLVNEIDQDGNIVHLTDLSCDFSQTETPRHLPEVACDFSTKLSTGDKEKLNKLMSGEDGVEEVFLDALSLIHI